MAVENLKSVQITKVEAATENKLGPELSGGRKRFAYGEVTTTETTGSNGSTYRMVRVPAHAYLISVKVRSDGTLNFTDADVGAASVSNASLLDDNSLANASSVTSTSGAETLTGVEGAPRQAWTYTGASKNPGGEIDLMVSLDADATAAGKLQMLVEYVVD